MPRPSKKAKLGDVGSPKTGRGRTSGAQAKVDTTSASKFEVLEQQMEDANQQLQRVETMIYELETKYLQQYGSQPNALKGYELLLTTNVARKQPKLEDERVFSGSSVGFVPPSTTR